MSASRLLLVPTGSKPLNRTLLTIQYCLEWLKYSLDQHPVFLFARRKKLRFHPRQLYPAAKQGEVQRVLLMLSEWTATFHLVSSVKSLFSIL